MNTKAISKNGDPSGPTSIHMCRASGKVTPSILDARWALDCLDQPTMRWLSKAAKRKRVSVAEVIYESVESFVAKCEAEADLDKKIIKFRRY